VILATRPSWVSFPRPPEVIFASPEGSCLFAAMIIDGQAVLFAYHWASFGASKGISLALGDFPLSSTSLTSFVTRPNAYFICMDRRYHRLRSVALDITRKSTEFSFKEKNQKGTWANSGKLTAHNSLIDCHVDIWTRFPVVPEVKRITIRSAADLQPRALVLAFDGNQSYFNSYWKDMIATFERNTQKPTHKELSSIRAQAITFSQFTSNLGFEVSKFLAGEWLVDLLCLIPIHIAVTRDNHFVPLKDGVLSADYDRALLGATVEQIVDNITFGWYESIFNSYMVSKASGSIFSFSYTLS
jgi:hypothetical protein